MARRNMLIFPLSQCGVTDPPPPPQDAGALSQTPSGQRHKLAEISHKGTLGSELLHAALLLLLLENPRLSSLPEPVILILTVFQDHVVLCVIHACHTEARVTHTE